MKPILYAAILGVFLSASGCTSMLIGNALNQGKDLTPEQIEAYGKVGLMTVGCLVVSGPPPAGSTIWIVLPKDSKYIPKFGENCHIVP